MKRWPFNLQSLSAQMILSSIALVLLMAAAAGLPAIWLIRGQFDRQAWAQVNQGSRAAQALYEAKQSELAGLATLTAQRPTLQDLLAQGDQAALNAYLDKNLDHPIGPFLYAISTMHCMTVSLAQGGEGLGTVWGEELAVKMLGDAGFKDVRVETLDHDIINNYYIMTKP